MLKQLLAMAFILCLSKAMVVGPMVYEQQDFGDYTQPTFLYSLSADCTAGTVNVLIMDDNNNPVQGAFSYLKYIDFSTPLISSVQSDKDGQVLHKLPGNVNLMRGLFILVIQKHGFRDKEIHFDLSPCYGNSTIPPRPVSQPPPQPQVNITIPQQNATQQAAQNQSTSGQTQNTTAPTAPNSIIKSACPSAFIFLLLFKFTNSMGNR